MLPRVLEPEVMDSAEEARDYDAMDHSRVNRTFVADFLQVWNGRNPILDVGTGTAQIPIQLCRSAPTADVLAVDLAEEMLAVGRENVRQAGYSNRIRLECCDAKRMPYAALFGAVISNSIMHHIRRPELVIAEMVRVTQRGGLLFVRDLSRPATEEDLELLVKTYAGDANERQQKMFSDSLRAALTVAEVREFVAALNGDPHSVQQTSDRHWTWQMRKA